MKWYNKDKTKMIDIAAINGYVYIPANEYIEQNPTESDVGDFKEHGDRIEIILSGSVFVFRGETAKELFELITNPAPPTEKELLKG